MNASLLASAPSTEMIDFLDYGLAHQFGDLHFFMDKESGMKAMVAIHNTNRGPALGGCRFIPYASTQEAILDCMRLARGMSYKAALANLPLGGGKAVIIEPATSYSRTQYFDAFGRFVHQLNGRYITALDSGTNLSDMDRIYAHTPYVASLSQLHGDPSPYTAQGVLVGIESMVRQVLGKNSLHGIHVAIQGLGHVGFKLAEYLYANGAVLTVSDIDPRKTQEAHQLFDAQVVDSALIHQTVCDVFSPCALGGIINDQTLPELQTSIIAGAANNQLAHSHHGDRLFEKNIAYAVDYVINAGGLIFAACQYLKTDQEQVHQQINLIADTLAQIYQESLASHQATNHVADRIAESRLL